MDGFELAELMRGNERTRRVPIIFVTAGSADRQRRFRGYEAGAVDFIQKPIEPDILRSKADVFFELYRQRQQIAAQRDALEGPIARRCRRPTAARTSFWPPWRMSCAIRWPPFATACEILRIVAGAAPTRTKSASMMDRQLVHLVRLIDDLLDVSRVSQGKIELRKEPIQAADVVRCGAWRPAGR